MGWDWGCRRDEWRERIDHEYNLIKCFLGGRGWMGWDGLCRGGNGIGLGWIGLGGVGVVDGMNDKERKGKER